MNTLKPQKQNGFTLIEMLLSIGMMMTLLAISIPIYRNFQTRNDLSSAHVAVEQSVRQARKQAVNGYLDTQWGIHIDPALITVFQGSSYAGRDSSFDYEVNVSQGVTVSGLSEVVFEKITGAPTATGTITLTSPEGLTTQITINEKGLLTD